jgi:NAD(P)-dependent dehydrogenase (short-subunit alcohol dehydrogenase family)
MDLKNAAALVSGGSSGIGRAVAATLSAAGARVAITGRNQERLTTAAQSLGVHPIRADVSVEEDVARTFRETLDKFGDLDILVNNAGIGVFKPLTDFPLEDFQKVFATNVVGAMLMAREAAKIFVKRNRGNIVNIASTSASFSSTRAKCSRTSPRPPGSRKKPTRASCAARKSLTRSKVCSRWMTGALRRSCRCSRQTRWINPNRP